MNSDKEKKLFTDYGWTYDFVAREWISPNGRAVVATDMLMEITGEPDGELSLLAFIVHNGVRPTS